MDLKCEFATIDVVSVLGTQQNVTQHVQKYPIDQSGVRRTYSQRNRQQHDVQLFDATVEETIEELHADGEDAVSLDEKTFEIALEENEYVFVDFFANWCSHCRDLAPTWETLAEVMYQAAENRVEEYEDVHTYSDEDYNEAMKVELPVLIAKVDCVDHHDFCMDQEIRAYPTLKFFVDGEEKGVYNGHRTVVEFTHFIAEMEKEHKGHKHPDLKSGEIKESEYKFASVCEMCPLLSTFMHRLNFGICYSAISSNTVATDRTIQTKEHEDYARALSATRHQHQPSWNEEEHPGCQLSGFLLVDRAPGNFHIQAQSRGHDLAAHMTNVSHIINHLSFGKPFSNYFIKRGLQNTPAGFLETTRPFDGNVYVTHKEHEAHHHYLKVITTEFDPESGAKRQYDKKKGFYKPLDKNRAYQILQSSQLSLYRADIVPEAKFTYDLSPIAVSYERTSRAWYDYFTSLMAIIGGTFTVVGMLESGIHTIASKKRR